MKRCPHLALAIRLQVAWQRLNAVIPLSRMDFISSVKIDVWTGKRGFAKGD